ncbi:MAG: hypothetical protein A2711_17775 [Burkholderiales bacterium RIFCSPHIGHO2_01_FULL_63_240]|nr:MAG: hypothetical protein A2711_17775 [Burkholderiales bacterium RIFCSPHIGHO2_01_FULL_63_240]
MGAGFTSQAMVTVLMAVVPVETTERLLATGYPLENSLQFFVETASSSALRGATQTFWEGALGAGVKVADREEDEA